MGKKQELNTRKGFTLVELIVVIAVLAILALILVPVGINYINDAQSSTCVSNTATLSRLARVGLLKDSDQVELSEPSILEYLADQGYSTKCSIDNSTDLKVYVHGDACNVYCPEHESAQASNNRVTNYDNELHRYIRTLTSTLKDPDVFNGLDFKNMSGYSLNGNSVYNQDSRVYKLLEKAGLTAETDISKINFYVGLNKDKTAVTEAYFIPGKTKTDYLLYDQIKAMGYDIPDKTVSGSNVDIEQRKKDFKAYYGYHYIYNDDDTVTIEECYMEQTVSNPTNSNIAAAKSNGKDYIYVIGKSPTDLEKTTETP